MKCCPESAFKLHDSKPRFFSFSILDQNLCGIDFAFVVFDFGVRHPESKGQSSKRSEVKGENQVKTSHDSISKVTENSNNVKVVCSGAVFYGVSSKVLLGCIIPYHSTPCRRQTAGRHNGRPVVGRPQGEFSILIFRPPLHNQ
jgi:hypothetical protein